MIGTPSTISENLMRIVCVDPRSDPLWDRLATTHPLASIFHSPGWIRILADTYGFEANAYIILDNTGIPLAGIPFCRISDIAGERFVALPFSDYCDPLVTDQQQWAALCTELVNQ